MKVLKAAAITAIAVGLLAGSASGTSVQGADSETDAGTNVVSPGPLGRSYADWGGEWLRWFLSIPAPEGGELPDALRCGAPHDQGEVILGPYLLYGLGATMDCTFASDQHLLLPFFIDLCTTDESLVARADKAKPRSKKAKALQGRIAKDRANAYQCIDFLRDAFRDAFSGKYHVTVDGERTVLDDSFVTVTTPYLRAATPDYLVSGPGLQYMRGEGQIPVSVTGVGWFAMIEPLEPGSHTIEWGSIGGKGIKFNAEIVEAAAE